MKCPKCKRGMRVEHTFKINGEAHTSRHTCPQCGRVCTCITLMVFDEPERGQGAFALCKKAKGKHIKEIQKTAKTLF